MNNLDELRQREHQQRLETNHLRREVYQQTSPAASPELFDSLREAEKVLSDIERKRAQAQVKDPHGNGLILDTEKDTGLLGPQTTGLEARLHLRMAQVPTSICHLLSPDLTPLVSCSVRNVEEEGKIRRLRVISFIEGYSSQAIDTVELEPLSKPHEFNQLPTLFPDRLRDLNELTRATLNVMVEDLDGKIELHQTKPIWLLARTTAPLAVMDPMTGQWQDLTRYFGAFVTPNAPDLMKFLRLAAELHPQRSLAGYQGDQDSVTPQVQALFNALKTEAHITYVNSVIAFSPEDGFANQRVRLPRESLQEKQANCIDGTVLFASLLEGISMSPAIIIVPGHAFVAWETWENSDEWKYIETTMIGSHTFEQACASAESQAKLYEALADSNGNESHFRRWPLRELRAVHRITPME